MSSFFEFGKTTIKVPNKMIFVNKQGYDNLTNPITKGGSITSRFGIKSLNVQPTEGNKIEIIESAPREMKPKPKAQPKPRTKKTNNKKEVEDLLGEMMNTKISKKIEMPEMPELPEPKVKKVKKVKQMMEVEPEPEEESKFLSDWLDIERVNKESGIQPEEMKIINVMYDLIDNYFKTAKVKESFKKVNFSQKAQEYIQNWIEKKKDGQTELSDFVKLVIYPSLKKDNKDIDNLTLLLFGLQIADEFKKKIDLKWGASKSQFNSYRVWKIFNQGKITGVQPELIRKIKEYKRAYGDWLDYREGPQAARKFKEPENNSSLKISKKVEPEETEETISANLQKLIYTSSIDKIKKSLNDLKYKGRMNTNKVLLNLQLLQNLDTNKQKELIKLLE
jgi:hypothetical protein